MATKNNNLHNAKKQKNDEFYTQLIDIEYDAIEVSKTCEIPIDYEGVMGVPITFLDKYNPNQFEIVGASRHNDLNMDGGYWLCGKNDATIKMFIVEF